LRFDDTLETVLAGDLGTAFGVQSAWRQLVDLIGRRRVYPDARALGILRRIRGEVPIAVRAASARGLEYANPPAALVRIFAVDELPVAIPVLRSARLTSSEWIELLPELAPGGRAILRHRRDLSPIVRRALETYGPVDFVLPDESQPVAEAVAVAIEADLPEPVAEIVESLEIEATPVQFIDWTDVIGPDEVRLAPAPAIEPPVALVPMEEAAEPEEIPAEPVAEEPVSPPAEAVEEALPPEREAAEMVEDYSFVALAGLAASLPNSTILESFAAPAIQSGTVEPVTAAEPIAAAAEPAQEPAMAPVDIAFADEPVAEIAPLAGPERAGPEPDPTGPMPSGVPVRRPASRCRRAP